MRDSLYFEVKGRISSHQTCSAAHLMRLFNIGYNRASWYIIQLEEDGNLSNTINPDGSRAILTNTDKEAQCSN